MPSPAIPLQSGRSSAVAMLAVAVAYIASARLGLALDAVGGFATLVWPPSGIAVAAVLLFGARVWPGIYAAAVVSNMLVGAPLVVALGIGTGNTLEALVVAYALTRAPDVRPDLSRLRDVVALVVATMAAAVVAASIGVASLALGGKLVAGALATWRAWWLGDAIGAIVVAPLILTWRPAMRVDRRRPGEAVALLATCVALSSIVFFTTADNGLRPALPAYLLFPVFIWAAARFGTRGATGTVFVTCVLAVWGTMSGHGPFTRDGLNASLIGLQTFMGVAAVTFLLLGATVAERSAARIAADRARHDAEHANRARADFLAVMSHELRTPLNAISGYVDLLLCGAQGPLTEAQLDSLRRVYRNYRQILCIIDDVLGFTRLETGQLAFRPQPVRVGEVLDAVEAVLQPDLRRKQIIFVREESHHALSCVADPDRLQQIVTNLLSNAVKFTPDSGRVTVAASQDNGRVRITVTDSGIGIPEDQRERVFDPFFKVERGTTRRYPGIGLGLTIARDLAVAMQGDLALDSSEGRGTSVTVTMPSVATQD